MALGNMDIRDVCNEARKLFSRLKKVNEHSMIALHEMGYNGFKRWHRYRAMQYYRLKIDAEVEMFDRFGVSPELSETDVEYRPGSVKEHVLEITGDCEGALADIAKLQNRYCELTGDTMRSLEKAQSLLYKDVERLRRMKLRFDECDWLVIDIHAVDDHYHKHYKALEKKSCDGFSHKEACCGHRV